MTFGTFFLPGPTEVRPEILAALTQPMIPHRGKAFEAVYARIDAGLKTVFQTSRHVHVMASSASGMMEAGVRNAPDGRLLALVGGSFAERFAKIAAACGREVETLAVPFGEAFDLDAVEARLRGGRFAVVTVVHSETSTGVLTDVRAVSEIAHRHGATCVVDSVTGLAAAELRFDDWGLDFVLTGSQKALALPPGLALAAASRDFLERAKSVPGRGLYFDLVEFEQFAEKNQTPSTPAISLLYALEAQVAAIAAEGMEARWARHAAMRDTTIAWVEGAGARFGLSVVAPAGSRSPTVTAIRMPDGKGSAPLVRAVAERGYVIGGGYGKLKESTFRIGHMGDHTVDGVNRCLAAVEEALAGAAR